MAMRMIVGLELLLEISYFLLEFLDLVFESLDPLFGIGVLVTSCLFSHESSLDFGYITLRAWAILYRRVVAQLAKPLNTEGTNVHEGKA